MLKDIVEQLWEPDIKYRGIPFWSWNDRLEQDELKWQIREMKDAGLGGYFMHARAGLKTPYMQEEWMQCIGACIEEGKRQGLGSWLYDENGYPSGFAGGKIPALGVDFQQKFLQFETIDAKTAREDSYTLGFYRTSGDYGYIEPDAIMEEDTVLRVYWRVNPYYTDLLNEDAVQAFIESTYQVYYDRFAEEFGKGILGIFTDEPQYGRAAMPWSHGISGKFKGKYGYDLLDKLSALYYQTGDCSKVRYDFWNLITELFTGACSKKLSQWCEDHHCKLAGHVLLEEDLCLQTMCSGSAMGFYRHMHIPAIDWLGRTTGNPVIVRQLASVSEQLGKDLVLSEMFAAAGWGINLSELKKIAEWQYSLGVNLICAHLEPYSIRGLRKRDHPPVLFYQANWWQEYRKFNDYFARLGMLLSEGEKAARILIIHPLRSCWVTFDESCYRSKNTELEAIDNAFLRLSEILTGLHMEYHYGDEDILAENGHISNQSFIVGNCCYDWVIIPPSVTLNRDTVRLLRGFIEGGGKVFAFNSFPSMMEGVESEGLKALKPRCELLTLDTADIRSKLGRAGCTGVSVRNGEGMEIEKIYCKVCRYPDGGAVYLLNMSDSEAYTAEVEIAGAKDLLELKLEDCSMTRLPVEACLNRSAIKLHFAPGQSHMLLSPDDPSGYAYKEAEVLDYPERCILNANWSVKPEELNTLVLDTCRLSLDGGVWSEAKPIIKHQQELLELGRDVEIALEFIVNSDCSFGKEKELYLVVEDCSQYRVEINGAGVSNTAAGWWKDKCMGKIPIQGLVQQGENRIILTTLFHNSPETLEKLARAKIFEAEANMLSFDSEIESIYLLGEFEVSAEGGYSPLERNACSTPGCFSLKEADGKKNCMELTQNGYPFFSGKVVFEQEIEIPDPERYDSVIFKMEQPYAAASRLILNGREAAVFLWQPCKAELMPFLQKGKNRIGIELMSSDRNLFGPHHHPEGELTQLGPIQFTDACGWTDTYSFLRFGLKGSPELQFSRKR